MPPMTAIAITKPISGMIMIDRREDADKVAVVGAGERRDAARDHEDEDLAAAWC